MKGKVQYENAHFSATTLILTSVHSAYLRDTTNGVQSTDDDEVNAFLLTQSKYINSEYVCIFLSSCAV